MKKPSFRSKMKSPLNDGFPSQNVILAKIVSKNTYGGAGTVHWIPPEG